jgi:hypothetical protein
MISYIVAYDILYVTRFWPALHMMLCLSVCLSVYMYVYVKHEYAHRLCMYITYMLYATVLMLYVCYIRCNASILHACMLYITCNGIRPSVSVSLSIYNCWSRRLLSVCLSVCTIHVCSIHVHRIQYKTI